VAKKKIKKSSQKVWIITAIVVGIFIVGAMVYKSLPKPDSSKIVSEQSTTFDFSNQKLMLNNQELLFVNGSYKNSDSYGEHTATINNRSVNPSGTRAAAILVDNPGGSGTFLYVVGSMLKDGREIYSEPVLLGDRIKIVSVTVDDAGTYDNGIITVEYLDRPANAPMVDAPSVKMISKFAFQDDGNLIVVLH
jgi:hypothetical protein